MTDVGGQTDALIVRVTSSFCRNRIKPLLCFVPRRFALPAA